MYSFLRLLLSRSRSKRASGQSSSGQLRSRPVVEILESRTLLSNRFVVPVGVPVDNVTTFATLQAALTTGTVNAGDTIQIESVTGEVGEKVTFGSVLAVHTDDKKVVLGSDASKASVSGKIVSHGRAKKITVLKFKKGNQYKISGGHRQNYTAVQVSDIKL